MLYFLFHIVPVWGFALLHPKEFSFCHGIYSQIKNSKKLSQIPFNCFPVSSEVGAASAAFFLCEISSRCFLECCCQESHMEIMGFASQCWAAHPEWVQFPAVRPGFREPPWSQPMAIKSICWLALWDIQKLADAGAVSSSLLCFCHKLQWHVGILWQTVVLLEPLTK